MLSLIYKLFVLLVLFVGGYLLMRFGMNIDHSVSAIVAFGVMPVGALILWYFEYRGRTFK